MNWLKRFFSKKPETVRQDADDRAAIESLRKQVAHAGVPALHLRAADAGGFSKLGGLPEMPPELPWPEWKGKPLAFLAQLDLGEIHQAMPSWLPESGCLYFFYVQDQSAWGFDPEDIGAWRVLFTLAARSELTDRSAPPGLEEECRFRPQPIRLHRFQSLPDSERFEAKGLSDDDSETYLGVRTEPFENLPMHQMFGFPNAVQNDDMENECQLASHGIYLGDAEGHKDSRAAGLKEGAKDWKLLLQLDSDDNLGWMWGDVGMLYFWVRESEASRGDFSKAWMVFQCC